MKTKDLILITSYTPDTERKNILLDSLKSINKNKFDIMISSHGLIPEEAYNYCDYFIYDKSNTLLFDSKYRLSFWYSCDVFKIHTIEYKDYNHIIAAGSLVNNGLSAAKSFGYSKVHWFDYDVVFLDDSELVENSKLLDSHSIVWYRHPSLITFSGMSFNLNKIDYDWFDTSNNAYYSFLDNTTIPTLELFNYLLILKRNDTFEKNISSLHDKIKINRYSSDEPDWTIVVYDDISKDFMFFNYNKTGTDNNINIIINNSHVKNFYTQQKQTWCIGSIGKSENIHHIKIIMNNKVVKDYDFNIINKEEYILKNKFLNE